MSLYLISGAIVILFLAWIIADQIRLRRRKGMSREQFVAAFRGENIPESIPAAVYDHYSSIAVGGYAASPDDSYEADLREEAEDIDDDAEDLLKKLKLQLPNESVHRGCSTPLTTIRDMVHWLDWVRRQQESNTSD